MTPWRTGRDPVTMPSSAFLRPESRMSDPSQPSTPEKKPRPVRRSLQPLPVRKLIEEDATGDWPRSGEASCAAKTQSRSGKVPEGDEAAIGGPASALSRQVDAVEVELDGEPWRMTVSGRAHVGHAGDSGAPILLVVFARSEEPDQPIREALAAGTELGRFSHHEIREIFRRSRPWAPPAPPATEDARRGREGYEGTAPRGRPG